MKNKLDKVDLSILSQLSGNAQMPYTEVAKSIDISPGTVHMRIKKMRDMGVINGTTLCLDYSHMGWKLTVFIGVYLKESRFYDEVIDALKIIPEVVKIHHITGKYDLFIKIHSKDIHHYRTIYQEEILTIKGIKKTEAFISMEENLNRHILFEE